jgi:hypothetical protein
MSETASQHETKPRADAPERKARKQPAREPVARVDVGQEFSYTGEDIKEKLGIESGKARVIVTHISPEAAAHGGEYMIQVKNAEGVSVILRKTGAELKPHLELRRRLNTAKEAFSKRAAQLAKTLESADARDVVPALEAAADKLIAEAATEKDFEQAMFQKMREAADVLVNARRALSHMDALVSRLVKNAKLSETSRADLKDALDANVEMYVSEAVHRILTGQSDETPYAIASELIRERVHSWTEANNQEHAQTLALENRLRGLDARLHEGRLELVRLEDLLEEANETESRNLLEEINKLDAAQLALGREWAHTYQALHPDADAASITAIGEELAGEGMIVGASLAGANTKREIVSRMETLKEASKLKDAPEALVSIVDADATTAEAISQVMDADPKAGKDMIAAAEKPKTAEEIRSSREYVAIQSGYQEAPVHERPKKFQEAVDFVDGNREFLEARMPAFLRAFDQWRKDTAVPVVAEYEPDEEEKLEDAFFERGDSGMASKAAAVSQALRIPIGEIHRLQTELPALQAELKSQFDKLRAKNPNDVGGLPELIKGLDFTYDDFMNATGKQSGVIKRFFTALARGEHMKPAGRKISDMYESIHRARTWIGENNLTREDWRQRGQLAADLRESIEVRRGLREPSFRHSKALESLPPNADLTPQFPKVAESDAAKAATAFENQLNKTKNNKAIRLMNSQIEKFEAKDRAYRDALTDFFERVNLHEAWVQQTEDNTVDQLNKTLEYDYYMNSVKDYRDFFNNIMREVRESPGREMLEEKLDAAGIKSFDDIVIASSNKRKFAKVWKTYVDVAKTVSSGSVGTLKGAEGRVYNEITKQ